MREILWYRVGWLCMGIGLTLMNQRPVLGLVLLGGFCVSGMFAIKANQQF